MKIYGKMVRFHPVTIHTVTQMISRKIMNPIKMRSSVTDIYHTPTFMNLGHAGMRQQKMTMPMMAPRSIFREDSTPTKAQIKNTYLNC